MKSMMLHYVYDSPSLVAQQAGQRVVVRTLLAEMMGAAKTDSGNLIPQPFRDWVVAVNAQYRDEEQERLRLRIAIDVMTSMTECQALLLVQRVTGIDCGSITESIVR